MLGFRENPHSGIVFEHVTDQNERLWYGKDSRHFAINGGCFDSKANESETLNAWILPKELCRGISIVNLYGYSYKYTLKLNTNKPICLFFSPVHSKHYVSLVAADLNLSHTAEFYTSKSLLLSNEAKKSCVGSLSCSFSAMEPFFVRLVGEVGKVLKVSMTSLQIPVLYSSCKSENIENRKIDNEILEITHEECTNPSHEMRIFWLYLLSVGVCFMVIIVVLHGIGYLNWKWFLCCKLDKKLQDLRPIISHEEESELEV